jgi:hypothetical protein
MGAVTVCPIYTVESELLQDMEGYDIITDTSWNLPKQMLIEGIFWFDLLSVSILYFPSRAL